MSIKKFIFLTLMSMLLAGCATTRSNNDIHPGESTTDTGVRYLLGRGVRQNDAQAFYYFNKAANEGDPFAQNEVAYMYAVGKGTQRDYTKALSYYQKAADHGLASAQYNLGLLYLHGMGTQPNPGLANYWFKQAASHGFEPAKQALARF